MHHTTRIPLAILLSMSACGLIKVNGKPLGGGGTSSSSSPVSEEPSSNKKYETDDENRARQQREYDAEEAQRVAARSGRPTWCKEYSFSEYESVDLTEFKDIDNPQHDWRLDATDFAEIMCATRGDHHELKPKVMALRAKWMKAHGLDESDFVVVVASRKNHGWDSQSYESIPGPVSQIPAADKAIQLDLWGPKVSMLARYAYVNDCLERRSPGVLDSIMCTREPLDAAAAYAEIDATKVLNPETRHNLRQLVFKTTPKLAAARSEVAAKAKDDPGIAQLVAIADAERKAWASPNPERAKLVAQLEAMEAATAANKRSGFTGCEATTYAAWADQVKGAKFGKATFESAVHVVLPAVVRDAESYLAVKAFSLCAKGLGVTTPMEWDNPAMLRRGPRTATIAAMIASRDSIKFDDKANDNLVPHASFWLSGRVLDGTIAKIVPAGDMLTISFKPELYKSTDCVESRKTGKIGFYTNGSPYAEEVCTKRAVVTHDSSPDDVSVPAFWAKGLKPGMFLLVGQERGFPIAVLSSREGTGTWALGAPLK
jgi:hypothetical protein